MELQRRHLALIPDGTLLGEILIERSGNVTMVYAAIGVITLGIAFRFTALGHTERYTNAS